MRNGIREKLLDEVTELEDVWQPGMATPDDPVPYAVVRFGDESSAGVRNLFDTDVQIYLYKDKTSYINLDELAQKVIDVLNRKVIEHGGRSFRLEYDGKGGDVEDEERGQISKVVYFLVGTVHG